MGAAFGAGIEYKVNERLDAIAGATYKLLFNSVSEIPDDDKLDWLKVYIGLTFRVR